MIDGSVRLAKSRSLVQAVASEWIGRSSVAMDRMECTVDLTEDYAYARLASDSRETDSDREGSGAEGAV